MTEQDIIEIPVTQEVITKTLQNTARKYRYTYEALMYNRTPVELLDNIYMGDLAKNALIAYLRERSSLEIVDYDEIRTDNFMEHDPGWDFTLGKKKVTVEVKSSIPPNNESRSNLIQYRDIKITASHDNGQTWIMPENIESNLHIQVYFYAKSYRNGYDSFKRLASDISKNYQIIDKIINASKYNHPLFLGWSSKKRIIEFHNTLPDKTWTFSWTSRIYWRCPIKDAYTMPQLLEVMEKLKQKEE